jgi:hypothetical protein
VVSAKWSFTMTEFEWKIMYLPLLKMDRLVKKEVTTVNSKALF